MDSAVAPVTLVTERLRLDQPLRSDAAAIAEICSGVSLRRWIPVLPQPYRLADAIAFVEEFVPRGWRAGVELTWVLRLADGQVVGSVGMNLERVEIVYWLGEAFRGLGYMQEAVRAVLDWWFANRVEQVSWRCLRGNVPSAAVARTAGFRYRASAPAVYAGETDLSRYWFAVLDVGDSREPQVGWPPASFSTKL